MKGTEHEYHDPEGMISKVNLYTNIEAFELEGNEAGFEIDNFDEQPWDGVNAGVELDIVDVKKGHDEEIKFMYTEHIYERRDYDECWNNPGKPPTSVRCSDTNKGSTENPNVRCRLVARVFQAKGTLRDLFAAMR